MKRLIMNPRAILPILLILVSTGFQAKAQDLPGVAVRFANPRFICETQSYCVDVEFISNTPDREVSDVNVRFFYDGSILQFLSIGNFQGNYDSPEDTIITGLPGSGPFYFGLNDPLKWYNGYVLLAGPGNPIPLKTTEWTMLFSICFTVIDPSYLGKDEFCPPLIWDLTKEIDPDIGDKTGFLPADDGIVISLVSTPESEPTTEDVVQFNWQYDNVPELPAGFPIPLICITTTCGDVIPLANWALFLAIGLMLVASVIIYRRRMG